MGGTALHIGGDGGHRTDVDQRILEPAWQTTHWAEIAHSVNPGRQAASTAPLWIYKSSGATNHNYRFVEPFMAAASYEVGAGTAAASGGYAAGSGNYPNSGTGRFDAFIGDIQAHAAGKTSLSNGYAKANDLHYYWVQHINGAATSGTSGSQVMSGQQRADFHSADGTEVFRKFIETATNIPPSTASSQVSQYFDLYKYKNEPLAAAYTDGKEDPKNVAQVSGKKVSWDLPELEDGVLYTLVYYVKLADGLEGSLSYPVCETAVTLQGVNFTWPVGGYIAPSHGVEDAESGATLPVDSGTKGYTGMDGHQDNRDGAKSTAQIMGYSPDIQPVIKGLRGGTAASGRAKAIVDVENGALMRFQWQYKEESGAWVDIFGATSSQYTLSAMFKAGQTYELRCKITNPAGAVTYTEALKVEATAAAKGGSLQSK